MTTIPQPLRRFAGIIGGKTGLACFKHAIPFVVFLFTVWLFHNQIIDYDHFPSDTLAHIHYAVTGVGYSLMGLALKALVKVFGTHASWAVAVFEALLAVGAYYPMAGLCRLILKNDWAACAVSGILLFWCGIFIPVLHPSYYYAAFVTQPWHNLTYFGMRLFAVLTLYGLFGVLRRYEERFTVWDWVKLVVPLVLATAIKPNFLLAFSLALALFLAIRVCMGKFALRSVLAAVKLGTVVLPSIAILYLQSRILYGGEGGETGEASGIAFVFKNSPWFSCGVIPFLWVCASSLALAVLVWAFHCRKGMWLTEGEYFLAIQELLGVFFFVFVVETGPRAFHGNFGWTSFVTGYLVYGAVVARFVRDLLDWRRGGWGRWVYLAAGSVLLVAHARSGFIYFKSLLHAVGGYMF